MPTLSRGLPAGLRGFEAGEQAARQAALQELQIGGTLSGLQQQALQREEAARKQEMEAKYRAALSSLAPDATPEDMLRVARPFVGPDTLVRTVQASQDRAAQQAATLTAARERIEANLEAARQRGADQRALMEMQLAGRQELARLAASLRQPVAPTIVEIADPNDPTKAIKIDARTREVIGNAPPKPKTERALPAPLQRQLTEAAELADATQRFSTTFKDKFAGKTITGDLTNVTGKIFGDDTGQSQWWQDYELHQSQIRNKLFGSALTAPEIEAWNKSAINPRMNPAQVKENLKRRNTLEQRGLERLVNGASAGGYSRDQIEAFTGRPVGQPAAPSAPTNSNRIKFDAQGNPL